MVNFKCTQCGKCCGGFPGYVWLSQDDIKKIATFLKISEKEFLKRYTRFCYGRYSLKELPQNYNCIFLQDGKCAIYELRPEQCRTFPFWQDTPSWWEWVKTICKGCN